MNVSLSLGNEFAHRYLKNGSLSKVFAFDCVSRFQCPEEIRQFWGQQPCPCPWVISKVTPNSLIRVGWQKRFSHSGIIYIPFFLPLVLNSFGKALQLLKIFCNQYFDILGEVWIPQIFSWLLRTAATRAAPRPEPSVDSMRSNLYSTWWKQTMQ